jgi:hypothetical protein
MTQKEKLQYWTVWYPRAAATGLLLARGRLDATDTLLLHAPGEVITVEVADEAGQRVALGEELKQTLVSPICRLRREGERVTREDCWPTEADYGLPVLLPGGEVGILQKWWNAEDQKSWRWQVEFFNEVGE